MFFLLILFFKHQTVNSTCNLNISIIESTPNCTFEFNDLKYKYNFLRQIFTKYIQINNERRTRYTIGFIIWSIFICLFGYYYGKCIVLQII